MVVSVSGRKCQECNEELPGSRRVLKALPPVLLIEVSEGHVQQHVIDAQDLSPVVTVPFELIEGQTTADHGLPFALYQLAGCTFSNGYHFSGAFQASGENTLVHGWYIYDGLTGHKIVGSLPPHTPPSSQLSFVIYSLLPPEYTIEAARFIQWFKFKR